MPAKSNNQQLDDDLNDIEQHEPEVVEVHSTGIEVEAALLDKWIESPEFPESDKKILSEIKEVKEKLIATEYSFPSIYQYMLDIENGNRRGYGKNRFHDEIMESRKLIQSLKNGVVYPRKILGAGATKQQAIEFLEKTIQTSTRALEYYGFGSSTNIRNYRYTLQDILNAGVDADFKSDEKLQSEKAEAAKAAEQARIKVIKDAEKAKKYLSSEFGKEISGGSSSILRHAFHIQSDDHETIITAAELKDPGLIGEYLKARPGRIKQIGKDQLNNEIALNSAFRAGVKHHHVVFKPRKGYVLIETEIDVSEGAKKRATEKLKAKAGLVSNPSLPYSRDNLPNAAIDEVVLRYGGDVNLAFEKAADDLIKMIDKANEAVAALAEFNENGPGMVFKSSGGDSYSILTKNGTGFRCYNFTRTQITGFNNYGDAIGAINALINYQGYTKMVGRDVLQKAMASEAWIGHADYEAKLRIDAPEQFEQESQSHYSEKIINALVEKFGWTSVDQLTASRTIVGAATGGELNQDGNRTVFATFKSDNRRRYLEVQLGFNTLFDVDCRDADIMLAAAHVDEKTGELTGVVEKTNALNEQEQEQNSSLSENEIQIQNLAKKYADRMGQDVRDMHLSFATAFYEKNLYGIEWIFNGLNSNSATVFFEQLGKKTPKTQKGMLEQALLWAGISQQDYDLKKAVDKYNRFIGRCVSKHGHEARESITIVNGAIHEGLTSLKKSGRDTWLVNPATGQGYNLSKKGLGLLKEIAEHRIALEALKQLSPNNGLDSTMVCALKYKELQTKLENRYRDRNGQLIVAREGKPTKYAVLETISSIKYLGIYKEDMIDSSRGISKQWLNNLYIRAIDKEKVTLKTSTDNKSQSSLEEHKPSENLQFTPSQWVAEKLEYHQVKGNYWEPNFSDLDSLGWNELDGYIEALSGTNAHSEAAILRAIRLGDSALIDRAKKYQKHVSENRCVLPEYLHIRDKLENELSFKEAQRTDQLIEWVLCRLSEDHTIGTVEQFQSGTKSAYLNKAGEHIEIGLKGLSTTIIAPKAEYALAQLCELWEEEKGKILSERFKECNEKQAKAISDLINSKQENSIAVGHSVNLLNGNLVLTISMPTGEQQIQVVDLNGAIHDLSETQNAQIQQLLKLISWDHWIGVQSIHTTAPYTLEKLDAERPKNEQIIQYELL